MKKHFYYLFTILVLIPLASYSRSKEEEVWGMLFFIALVLPYYAFAIIPLLLTLFNKGGSFFLSLITYILSVVAIGAASYYYSLEGFSNDDSILNYYFLSIFPFVLLIIVTAYKNY